MKCFCNENIEVQFLHKQIHSYHLSTTNIKLYEIKKKLIYI